MKCLLPSLFIDWDKRRVATVLQLLSVLWAIKTPVRQILRIGKAIAGHVTASIESFLIKLIALAFAHRITHSTNYGGR
jgi:hypothetical protein